MYLVCGGNPSTLNNTSFVSRRIRYELQFTEAAQGAQQKGEGEGANGLAVDDDCWPSRAQFPLEGTVAQTPHTQLSDVPSE